MRPPLSARVAGTGRRRPASTALYGALLAGGMCLPLVLGGPSFDARRAEDANHRQVVAGMTADFADLGLGPDQARMLARQTADFGTLGEMTTVAAIGIGTAGPGREARGEARADDCASGPRVP